MTKSKIVITSLILIISFSVIASKTESKSNDDNYKITILFNNSVNDNEHNLDAAGGFSALIQYNDEAILFDVGGNYHSLLENIDKLSLNEIKLNGIVISHNHWDHVYGLPGAMQLMRSDSRVYAPGSAFDAISMQYPRAKVNNITLPMEIFPNIWTSGEMDATIFNSEFSEQSLFILKNQKVYIVTGCSHPGIVKIAEKAKELFPDYEIEMIMGGFHLRAYGENELKVIKNDLKSLCVKKIAPSHCTGENVIEFFQKQWGDNFIQMYLGDAYEF